MEKKKREYIRIGDVFCVEFEHKYKYYFQYIANDNTMLNSRVIRIFAQKYKIDAPVNIERIVSGSILFYSHTTIRQGIIEKYWYKCGNSKECGNIDNIFFRYFSFGNYSKMEKSDNWNVWKINTPFLKVGTLPPKMQKYDLGVVFPPIDIYIKIKTGKYRGNISNIR